MICSLVEVQKETLRKLWKKKMSEIKCDGWKKFGTWNILYKIYFIYSILAHIYNLKNVYVIQDECRI